MYFQDAAFNQWPWACLTSPVILIAVGIRDQLHPVDDSDHHDDAAICCLSLCSEDGVGRPEEDCTQIEERQDGCEQLWPPSFELHPLAQLNGRYFLLVRSNGGLASTSRGTLVNF